MGEANVAQLRAQLSMLEGVDCEQLNLFCSGSPLEDEVNLAALENLTIQLTVPLLGGKVHGSLARAGKVRGQTPKVREGTPCWLQSSQSLGQLQPRPEDQILHQTDLFLLLQSPWC